MPEPPGRTRRASNREQQGSGYCTRSWYVMSPFGHCEASSLMTAPEPSSLIPVTLLTGFLGSGKTTVLNHVLKQPEMAATAVIVNEFGEIGLDHLLVEQSSEDVVLLNCGCLCCTVGNDIVDTLTILFVHWVKSKI